MGKRMTDYVTVRRDIEKKTWSYRVERTIDGVYAGIISWGNTELTRYTDFCKAINWRLPPLKDMERDGNSWSYTI